MAIEILVPTSRSLAGAAGALLDRLLGVGFHNIDRPETGPLEVEIMNVEGEEWAQLVPDDLEPGEVEASIRSDRTVVRVRIGLRLGCFLLFPRFVILCRPDEYADFRSDPRARQIIGRESLELARAFEAPELVVAGDAASDFLGTEATTWEELKEVLEEEEVPHEVIALK